MAAFYYRFCQVIPLLYYIICQVLALLYVKLCHTFWNFCDTFVTYLYTYLLQDVKFFT